ncbi:MAG: Maf-like protein [Bacillota bacterium]|nr:Maf-like protein [Bacillota bacterium]
MRLVLASSSPRRYELLKKITENFIQIPSKFDETQAVNDSEISNYVINIAEGKALEVAGRTKDSIVIGCDTIVELDGTIIGKPKNKQEAFNVLKSLSGRRHSVYTGIYLINTETKESIGDFEKSDVYFSKLTDEEINWYISTKEPLDKAGSYGIQGYGSRFVERIEGCYFNIVGLPVNKLYSMLKLMEVNLFLGDF